MWVGIVALIAGAGSTGALADGSAQAGESKAGVCVACHGPSGNSSNPEWPNLAEQHASYIAEQLRLFKAGNRANPVMMPMAQSLSDQDMLDVAAYYETQKPKGGEADPSYWEAGQKLYRGGDPTRQIPACIACHGPLGRGNAPGKYPALRAQHSVYTQKQLQDYAAGTRYTAQTPQTEQMKMMHAIASRLSPEDIRNVASYIQGMR
jgi:cytochrome c553